MFQWKNKDSDKKKVDYKISCVLNICIILIYFLFELDARRASDDKGDKGATSSTSGVKSEVKTSAGTSANLDSATTEEAMLEKALAISMSQNADAKTSKASASSVPDFSSMTEEEQVQYAMQMSLAQEEAEQPMETDDDQKADEDKKK